MWAMLAGVFIRILHARETCFTGRYSIALLLSNLWITFLLSKSYVGNVGNVGYGFKSRRRFCIRAYSRHYCHIYNKNKLL
jgi:hypothetical protein